MVFPHKYGVIVLLIAVAMILSGCIQPAPSGPGTSGGYRDVTAEEARSIKHASEGKLIIIDLSADFTGGHLPMAINIPSGSLEEKIPTLDKSRPYLVYARTDDASITGATKLVNAGFSPVYRLKGNYEAWVSAGYPEV
jgi:rhodanese-related sulfurtransferase